MRYIGGKYRLAKRISETILARESERLHYVEPFVGGAAVLVKMAPHFSCSEASDASEDIILMWQALREGWVPDNVVTEEEYAALRTAEPSPFRSVVGFGGSFGGKWFGGYARGGLEADGSPRNHLAESVRSVLKTRDALADYDVTFRHCDYRNARVRPWSVVYCDPPYANTQGYKSVESFDTEAFWATMDAWSEFGASVYVSEYTAPPGWVSLWESEQLTNLKTTEQGRFTATERLWVRE